MYKQQLKFQKLICMLCIIAAAITFVYALGIMTDLYDALYFTMWNPDDLTMTDVPGSIIFYDMQQFNKDFVNASIVLILLACLLLITNTHTRRKYYIANYAATGIFSVASAALCLWSHQQIEAFKLQFQTTVDFEALKVYAEKKKSLFLGPDDTFLFDLHYLVAGVCLLAVVLLLANMIWKILLMRSENKLIQAGKEAAV